MKRNTKRKEEILNAASRLFKKQGYAATSMRTLAEHVGIEPSSLYSHIRSKEEILTSICMMRAEEFSEGMNQINNTETSPLMKIERLIDLHVHIAKTHPSSITVFNDEWKHLPPPAMEAFLNKRRQYENDFIQIISDGMKEGMIRSFSPVTAFNLIINCLKWIHYNPNRSNEEDSDQVIRDVKQFMLKALEM